MQRILTILAAMTVVAGLTGCPPAAKTQKASGAHAACAGPQVDLTKLSGDWIAAAPVLDPAGSYPGNQYRIRFDSIAADGSAKAHMAWRLDSRPYGGKVEKNEFGGELVLLEDMTDETIAGLKKANNQDPNLPMRSAIHVSPTETGCSITITDNFQTYLGEKVIEKTSPIGTLKMVPAPAGPVYSFVRCEVQRGITFDGKTDDGSRPVVLTPDKPTALKAVAAKSAFPADCTTFDADVFVDGVRVAEKVAGKLGTEDKVPAVIWEHTVSIPRGPLHGVELHAYGACGTTRKLVASACNVAYAQ